MSVAQQGRDDYWQFRIHVFLSVPSLYLRHLLLTLSLSPTNFNRFIKYLMALYLVAYLYGVIEAK